MHGHFTGKYTNQFGLLSYIWMPLNNERLFFKSGIIYSKVQGLDYIVTYLNGEHDYII